MKLNYGIKKINNIIPLSYIFVLYFIYINIEGVRALNKVKVDHTDKLAYYKLACFLKDYINEKSIIVCIGTDKCIGDCLGPLVGTYLKNANFCLPVYGTTENPIHALNLRNKLDLINKLHSDANIIGVDACLGEDDSIGEIQVRNYPIHPGNGVGKSLPSVGTMSLVGIVDSNASSEIFSSRSIRLDLIIKMANVIKKSIIHSYYLYMEENF